MAIPSDTSQVTPRMESVCHLLAAGYSLVKAAERTHTAEQTVKQWNLLPHFKARVRELRRDITEQCAGVLAEGMVSASWTLRKLLESKSESVRLKAAELILTIGHATITVAEMEARLVAVEGRRK